jgi:hypothetical protein
MKNALFLAAVVLSGCGSLEATAIESDSEVIADGAELTTELKATTAGLTVYVTPTLTTRGTRFIISGRASKDLSAVASRQDDVPFATASLTGTRTFELSLNQATELGPLLSGAPLFVDVTTTSGTTVTARVLLVTRATQVSGSTKITVPSTIAPVAARGTLIFRLAAKTVTAGASLSVAVGSQRVAVGQGSTSSAWNVDLTLEQLRAGLSSAEPETFTAVEPSGTSRVKTATLAATVNSLAVTTQSTDVAWPDLTCASPVQDCLNHVAVGVDDFAVCGSYLAVMACGLPNQVPTLLATTDDMSALTQAVAAVKAALPSNESLTVAVFDIDASTAPAIELVNRAWLDQGSLQAVTIVGAATTATVNDALDGFGARALVPAAQQVVGQNAWRAFETDSQKTTRGVVTKTRNLLLQFPSAERLVVFSLSSH